MTEPFRILVLCTGNICRSPAGHLLLQHRLGATVEVTSAGTHAMRGYPVDPQMAALLPPDAGAETFAARQLSPAMLKASELVLAMTREHRALAVELFPAAVRRTFTLREFARVLALPRAYAAAPTPGDFLRGAVPRATQLRTQVRAVNAADDDVRDPYGHDDAVFADVYAEIDRATADIAAVVRA